MRLRLFIEMLSRHRHVALAAFDAVAWFCAAAVATLARLDFDPTRVAWGPTIAFATFATVLFTAIAWATRLHDGRAPLGSLDEMVRLGVTNFVVGTVAIAINLLLPQPYVPRSVPMIAMILALVVMAWGRATVRIVREHVSKDHFWDREPVILIGVCESGRQLIRSMRMEPASRWHPVGILNDDPHNRYRRIDGVPVLGGSADLSAIAALHGVRTAVVADPGADGAFLRRMSHLGISAGLSVKVLPGVNALLNGHAGIRDVRDIDLPDLLGRRQLDTGLHTAAQYLTGSRVLVTGAGGSIGSELCRQISRWNPTELIMLDRDESALHDVQLSINRRAMLDSPNLVLADIRDVRRIQDIFSLWRPQIVFHAAALKHLPLLEQHPQEAIKTNVWGTLTVLEAAQNVAVDRFVNISTDKAANPISVLGYSKRLTERLTASVGAGCRGTFLSVRFGNVLGSRGSVLTAFASQIAAGRPVTVTHPDVTRYFMTVDEAVQLVIQAAAVGLPGEALVLDMGQPVRIDDVAKHLIRAAGADIDIDYIGLRSGEKLNEDLFGDGEVDHRRTHPLVSHVAVPGVDVAAVRAIDPGAGNAVVVQRLRELCDLTADHQATEASSALGTSA